jgi:hypothetical protein
MKESSKMTETENEAPYSEEHARPPGGDSGPVTALSRYDLLAILNQTISTLHTKFVTGRIRNERTEKIRLDIARTLGYLSSVSLSFLREEKLADIERRLEALERGGIRDDEVKRTVPDDLEDALHDYDEVVREIRAREAERHC